MSDPTQDHEAAARETVRRCYHTTGAIIHVGACADCIAADRAEAVRQAREEAMGDPCLVQCHPFRGGAEVVVKRRHKFQVWAGNLVEVNNPHAYYSPDEGDAIRARSECATPGREPNYPCADCGAPRTKEQGGTTFTVCDDCWDKHYGKRGVRATPADEGKDSKEGR